MLAGLELARLVVPVEKARRLPERRGGAEKNSLDAAAHAAFVFGERGDIVAAHAGLDLLQHAREDLILHVRAFADEVLLLVALDRLQAVDDFGRVDEFRLPFQLALDAHDEFVRHGAGADPADGAIAAMLELGRDDLRLVFVGIGDRRKGRREQQLADAAEALVAPVDLAAHALGAHVDRNHQVGGGKDHAARNVAVGQRGIGEPAHIAAHEVIAVLHDQRVDVALGHGLARRGPAAIELGGRDRVEKPFVHHDFPVLKIAFRSAWAASWRAPAGPLHCPARSAVFARPSGPRSQCTNSTGFISPTG